VEQQNGRASEAIRRRVYIVALGVVAPLLPVIALARVADEPFAVPVYLAMFAGMTGTLLGLLTRQLTSAQAEVAVVVGVTGVVMARLIGVVYIADLASDQVRQIVTETIGPTLVACVLVIYLATGLRQARRWAVALCSTFVVVVTPRLVADWSTDPGLAVALLRQALTLAVVAGLAYGLASLKTQLTEERVRARALDELANTDPLTGVSNRRGAQQLLLRHLALVDRYGGHLSVALVDLDRFKQRNDHHGHAAGDQALVDVVSALQRELRATDVLARWGGDELLIVAPGLPPEDACHSAERWRTIVADLGISAGAERVTASIGLATHRPGDTLDRLLIRADRVMYEAKGRGGDAVRTDRGVPDLPAGSVSDTRERVRIVTLPNGDSARV
jgi:diguanylate cyclase (GGDEF)-like protein